VVYANVALYALCYQMQAPVLPYLTRSLGAGAQGYGMMMTVFGVVQFFGGLLAGPLADMYSGELLMLISFAASSLCYLLTASASGMWMLYVSRIPTLLQHAVLAARTIVAENSLEVDRARMLGYIGLAYGVGLAFGPAFGGTISEHWLQLSAWVATGGSLLSVMLLLRFLPKCREFALKAVQLKHSQHDDVDAEDGQKPLIKHPPSRLNPSEMWRVCNMKGVISLLAVKMLTGLGSGLFHAIFALVAKDQFELASSETGMVMSYVGILTMFSQAFLIEWATVRFSERIIVLVCTGVLGAAFLALAAATTATHLFIVLVPLIPAGCLLSTVNTSQLTKAAPKDSGTIIAIDMSVGSLVHIITPVVSTYILTQYGYPYVLVCSASLCALLLGLIRIGVVVNM